MILAGLTSLLENLLGENFASEYNSSVTWDVLLFVIIVVFVLSLVILLTYKRTFQTTVYNKSFAVSLPILAMVTSVIIITVSSNIILSLGMVGALSIVRFRTAIKNPLDTVFMFWAVGLGITAGAGQIIVAIISTVIIAAVLFLLLWLEVFVDSHFLIIRAGAKEDEEAILTQVKEIYGRYTLRNKTVKKESLDLTLEVRSKKDKTTLINKIHDIESVRSVILLSHNGDYIAE